MKIKNHLSRLQNTQKSGGAALCIVALKFQPERGVRSD